MGRLLDDDVSRYGRAVPGLPVTQGARDRLESEDVTLGDVPQEVLDVGIRGMEHEVHRRAHLHDRAIAHDGDPITELHRLAEVVGDEDHGLAELAMQSDDLVLHVAADERVERAERLVEEHHIRVYDEGAGQAHTLLHATRQLLGVGIGVARQPHELDDLLRAGIAIFLLHTLDLEGVGDVVDHLAVGKEAEVLEDHREFRAPQVTQLLVIRLEDVFALDDDFTRCRVHEAGEAAHEGRLARAGESHDDEDLALGDIEGDVADRRGAPRVREQLVAGKVGVRRAHDLVGLRAEDLPQVAHRDGR